MRTVGTFRVVAETDVVREAADAQLAERQLGHLVEEGLLERRTAIVSHEPMHLLTLTDEGRSLLELHRETPMGERVQAYHAGVVKPRELAHDVQLYRAYQAEVTRLQADGAKVTRVVLDYEIKRDYQRFLRRRDREVGASIATDREAFARVHDLPIVDDHLELPDLRVEVEYADGRRGVRDVEIVTEHYSRGQLAGKVRAGFSCYKPARTSFGRGTSRGAAPLDSDRLVWLE